MSIRLTPWLSKRVVYPFYERATGRRVLTNLRGFEADQWLSPQQLDELARIRLAALLEHARTQVPFYRTRLAGHDLSPAALAQPERFLALPFLEKEAILASKETLIAQNFTTQELKANATGGSTGHTLTFFNDLASLDVRSAVTIRGDRWAGLDVGTPHVRLWGAPSDLNAQEQRSHQIANWLLNRTWLDCFRLSDAILADYVAQLRRLRPRVLMGYATALTTLARYLQVHQVADLQIDAVISSAETLFDDQRTLLEEVFRCKVYNRYGCREAGPLVVECAHGALHVNSDYVYLELLRDGRPAAPGETGEIVITPLFGYGMPLIRYRIGDLAQAAEQRPCPCGRGLPTVQRIIGRTTDMLVNGRGESFHGEYFTHLFYHQPGVRQFQVVQTDPTQLTFALVTDAHFDPALMDRLTAQIHEFMGPISIEWQLVDHIPPQPSGKHRFTISHVPLEWTP